MEQPPIAFDQSSVRSLLSMPANESESQAGSALREDVLTHITKSAVQSVSGGLNLDLSEETSSSAATWIVRAAKSVPLFTPGTRGLRTAMYGAAALLYGASEMKWGDSAENMGKDALLGALKGVGIKGSMEAIGRGMHGAGLEKKIWSAPALGVAFGVSSTGFETGLSRSTYFDETGQYRGIGYGLANTGKAVASVENLLTGAATFTLGAAGMKALQASPLASAFPKLMGSYAFQNVATGASFGTFSGMAEEASRQVKEGGFAAWQLNKYDYGQIGKQALFTATSDAAGAMVGAKLGRPVSAVETKGGKINPPTVESVERIDKPAELAINDRAFINEIVETPLRSSVAALWDKNIRTLESGVYRQQGRDWQGGTPLHIGEYEAPYYQFTLGKDGKYYSVNHSRPAPESQHSRPDSHSAYIVLDDSSLSAANQLIARRIGRIREDFKLELNVPVDPGTPAKQLEQAMLTLANRFEPQPLTWGFQTPLQYYREKMNVDRGLPTEDWMAAAIKSPEFNERGLVYDPDQNLIFASKEMSEKFKASPPAEPTWYRGPETFGANSRNGWRQAYTMAAVHLYSPSGHGIDAPNPATARIPEKNFDLQDLMRSENANYYLANKDQFFELFGSKAFDDLADRHWLELRKTAFESVEKHWPMASIEKDRAIALGTLLIARSASGLGPIPANETGLMSVFVPEYLWREPSGRHLNHPEVMEIANKIYDDMDLARRTPFDHTFGQEMIKRMEGPDGDKATDRSQFRPDHERSLGNIVKNGWTMQVDSKYAPLLAEILQKQSEGQIPERFEQSVDADGTTIYTPVYRRATVEEHILPLSELVKNLRIVDYGFKNADGSPSLGKVSLASHDVHDHARAFWLLEKEGLFDGTRYRYGYDDLMGRLADPLNAGMFKRQGELVASVAYDWRNYFDLHPEYQPAVDLMDVRNYFLGADRRGIPLTKNQSAALMYLEERIQTDPEGNTQASKKLRHILGGVWLETLEQKRKTETPLWLRADGTYQRMSPTNPEYLAFVIDATRVLEEHGPHLREALIQNNLKMEEYLQGVATSPPGSAVPGLHYTPQDITWPAAARPDSISFLTEHWLEQHPGFNTRRAPIRNWLIGGTSQFDPPVERYGFPEYGSSEWRRMMDGPD